MSKVTLDKEMFKALASETRLGVLHALDERRKTTTEIAAELELNKATVHEHIKLLTAVGLIKKIDEGRKWIYHELTWDGRKLLHPDQGTIFNVLLTLSVLASGGAMGLFGQAAGWWLASAPDSAKNHLPDMQFDAGTEDSQGETAPAAGQSASSSSSSSQSSSSSASSSPSSGNQAASSTGSSSAAPGDEMALGSGSDMDSALDSDVDGGFPWGGLALALTAFLLISLAIFLRKRK